MKIRLEQTQLRLRNSTTRIAFRYGTACLTSCPQAVLGATLVLDGKTGRGYSGDCLPPSWFDKSPERDYAGQINDMLAVIALAKDVFLQEFARPTEFFPAWMAACERVHRRATERGFTPLLASFGGSLLERAILDAMARAAGLSLARAVRENLFGIVSGEVYPELAGLQIADWLPAEPRRHVYVRHTVGLGDPLTLGDIPAEERLHDGFPQTLQEYIERKGTRYFKIKLSSDVDRDVDRLSTIAALIERFRGADYRLTLDGNEQYKQIDQFQRLIDKICATPALKTLVANTLVIEQPLDRKIALSEQHAAGISRLCRFKPVIIDESDATLDAYPKAIRFGYRGVSSKNCKGSIKSLLAAGLTWVANDRGARADYLMTGEDLCSVGIIPVQADLCLAATLGLEHVERNGHHYHQGLSYLPESQRRAALAAHPDFYALQHGVVSPHLADGRFEIGSLQCTGFGFAVEPDFAGMQSPSEWQFSSLGV